MADEIHMPQSNAPTVVTVYVDAPPGEDGDDGRSATLRIGTVTTLPAGSAATVANVGTALDAVFDFGIPRGADGSGGGGSPALLVEIGPASKISDLPDAASIDGSELTVLVQAGGDVKSTVQDVANFISGALPSSILTEVPGNLSISAMMNSASLDGSEFVPLVQAGGNVKSTLTDIAAFIALPFLPLAGGQMIGTIATTNSGSGAIPIMSCPSGEQLITNNGDLCYPFGYGQLTVSQALCWPGTGSDATGPTCLAIVSGQPVMFYPAAGMLINTTLDLCFADGTPCLNGTTADIQAHDGHVFVNAAGDILYGDGATILAPVSGSPVLNYPTPPSMSHVAWLADSSGNLYYSNGTPLIDGSGPNALDPIGNKVWDSSGNRYYGDGTTIMVPAGVTVVNDSSGSPGSTGDVPVNNGGGFTWQAPAAANQNPYPTQINSGATLSALSDPVVYVDTSGGGVTVTLPGSPTDGEWYTIIAAGSGALTITPSGSGTALAIDGIAASLVLPVLSGNIAIKLIYDSNNGIGWKTVSGTTYKPGTSVNWNGTAPNRITEALDRIVAWIATNSAALALVGVVGKP